MSAEKGTVKVLLHASSPCHGILQQVFAALEVVVGLLQLAQVTVRYTVCSPRQPACS